MAVENAEVSLDLQHGYEFLVDFHQPGVPSLRIDEPPPLGAGAGPNAARLLAAAVANCLGASLLLCLRKARIEVSNLRVTANVEFQRNEQGRLRIAILEVTLQPEVPADALSRMGRCLEIFEDYCIVTQSVRAGVDVRVNVAPVVPSTLPA